MAESKIELDSTKKVFLKIGIKLDSLEQTAAVFNCKDLTFTKINDAINNKLFTDSADIPPHIIFSDCDSQETEFSEEEEPLQNTPRTNASQ